MLLGSAVKDYRIKAKICKVNIQDLKLADCLVISCYTF